METGVIIDYMWGYVGVILGLYWVYIGILQGAMWGIDRVCIGIIGSYWGYIGIMKNRVETTVMGYTAIIC